MNKPMDSDETNGVPEPIDNEPLTDVLRHETMQELVYGRDGDPQVEKEMR